MEKEISSEQVRAGKRTYFLDLKATKDGSKYLQITESKKKGEEFERHSIMIFEEDISKFCQTFIKSVLQMVSITLNSDSKSNINVEINNEKPRKAYEPWQKEDDELLELLFCQKKMTKEIAGELGRNEGAIRSRIEKLGLKEKYNF